MSAVGVSANTYSEAYRSSLEEVLQDGEDVEVRGFQTKELLNYITIIQNPRDHCVLVPGRRWNPWLALSEALWIMAGRQDIYPLLPYNKRIKEFSDDGETLAGAYGWRVKRQIPYLLERLKKDSNDRAAVLSIWREDDLWAETLDRPCNDMIMFKLRKNRLHMTVMNRSNDLHWGLYAVNLPTFGLLQEWIAAYLGVEVGYQTHVSNSLHVYTGGPGMKPNYDITKNMMARIHEPLPEMPWHKPAFTEKTKYEDLRLACSTILNGAPYKGIPFLEFAQDFLKIYKDERGGECRHAEDHMDWIMAGVKWEEEGEKFK